MVGQMVRLTIFYCWIVLPLLGGAIAAGYYYTRPDNITYKVNAVVCLNGPSVMQFEQAFEPMRTGHLIPAEAPIAQYMSKVSAFNTYRIVDCKKDGSADVIDYKKKSSPTDTVKVQMQDRLSIQFRIKSPDLGMVPEIEKALLEYLNANEAMQASYAAYKANMNDFVAFNHQQLENLDTLTRNYCQAEEMHQRAALVAERGKQVLTAENKIDLSYLREIPKFQEYVNQVDYRAQIATAPVTLENHFAVDPNPVNGRRQCLPIFALCGWIIGCIIAQMIAKRKAIYAWLKK